MCIFPSFHNNNHKAHAQEQAVDYADFLVTSDRTNIANTAEHFVVRIVDPVMIEEARAELEKEKGFKIISGTIEKTVVDWNPGWSYHFIPDTIFFGDFFIEVCDASATYIEENLAEAGGAFLPRLQWCPWGTRVLEEITGAGGPQPRPTMAPAVPQPPSPASRCAARGEICTEKMTCCSTDDICRGICARKTTNNNKAGNKSNLKLDFDAVERGMRTGGGRTRHRRRILKGSSS
jgi:hypothetical protein